MQIELWLDCMYEESEKDSIEMKQLREEWRSCTRDNFEADESYIVDWRS